MEIQREKKNSYTNKSESDTGGWYIFKSSQFLNSLKEIIQAHSQPNLFLMLSLLSKSLMAQGRQGIKNPKYATFKKNHFLQCVITFQRQVKTQESSITSYISVASDFYNVKASYEMTTKFPHGWNT